MGERHTLVAREENAGILKETATEEVGKSVIFLVEGEHAGIGSARTSVKIMQNEVITIRAITYECQEFRRLSSRPLRA